MRKYLLILSALLVLVWTLPAYAGELISPYAERESIGGGKYRTTISSAPIAYEENGTLKRIDSNFVDGDAEYPNVVNASKMRVKIKQDGARIFYPTSNPEKYLILGRPYVLDASLNWKYVNFGAPVRSGNKLTWTKPEGIVTMAHTGIGVKHEIELLGGFVPRESKFAYPLTLQGLTRQGNDLYDNGTLVATLDRPIVYDASNLSDVRNISYSFESLNGVTPAVISTLPDLTGMTRPVVDPTVTIQPALADNPIYDDSPNTNFATAAGLYFGEARLAAETARTLISFEQTTIPDSFVAATLWLYFNFDGADNARTLRVYPLTQAWSLTQSTWNVYSTGNVWPGGAGAGGDIGVEIGSRAFGAAETIPEWKAIPLTVTTKAALGTLGWLLKMDTESDDMYGCVSSDSADAVHRPKLVIEYASGGSTSGGYRDSRLNPRQNPRQNPRTW